MTPPPAQIPTPHEAIAAAVKEDFQYATRPCPTSGVISAAVELLEALQEAAAGRAIEPGDFSNIHHDAGLAPVALHAQVEAFRRQHHANIDALDLLAEVVHATGEQLGQDVTILEGPVPYPDAPAGSGGYVVVQRTTKTPAWGPEGNFNLVVHLRWSDDRITSKAWEWTAHPDAGALSTGHYITIIAPPPSPASAAEVGERIAGVLSGDVKAWPTTRLPVG